MACSYNPTSSQFPIVGSCILSKLPQNSRHGSVGSPERSYVVVVTHGFVTGFASITLT